MNAGDTIVAAASGAGGRGARAVVRLSGPGVRGVLGKGGVVREELVWPAPGAGACIMLAEVRAGGIAAWLPCLAVLYAGPRSYTGEDCAELLVPGNPVLVERVMASLLHAPGGGVRLATPGEFSARAYLNGRLTLAQAEGVAATIAARTDEELAAAERLLSGETGRLFLGWRDELADLLALVEAGIDFTDQEDVVPIAPARLWRRLSALGAAVGEHLGAARGAEQRETLPTVALAGPPNAGKSTLFNALLGRRRAVVSPMAGTTRDVLVERLELGEELTGARAGVGETAVMLLDLAGLDEPDGGDQVERDAQARARAALAGADVVVHCDARGRFDTDVPGDAARPVIRVRTKADLPGAAADARTLAVCSLDGYNLGVLRRGIADAVAGEDGGRSGGAWLSPRHRRALTRTLDGIERAMERVPVGAHALASPELTAGAMRGALDELGELTGEVTPDDVIGRVFATFCIGK